jgi:hypothetical protein
VPLNTESASCVRYQNCRAHARRHSALPTAAPIHKAPYAAMCMHQCARAPTQTAARVLPICYSTPTLECRHMQSLKQPMSLHATTRGFYTTDQTHLPVGNVQAGLGTLPPSRSCAPATCCNATDAWARAACVLGGATLALHCQQGGLQCAQAAGRCQLRFSNQTGHSANALTPPGPWASTMSGRHTRASARCTS